MTADRQIEIISRRLSGRQRGLLGFQDARRTAVLILLQPNATGELEVLFEHRAHTLRRQPGEISFPGGHVEDHDESEAATAVREAGEELGVAASSIELIGALDVFPASSHLLVYPFVGILPQGLRLSPNAAEVAEVFSVPYSRLLEYQPEVYDVTQRPEFPDDFPFHMIPHGRDYNWRTSVHRQYFFNVDGWVIWGLTARILQHFLDLVRHNASDDTRQS